MAQCSSYCAPRPDVRSGWDYCDGLNKLDDDPDGHQHLVCLRNRIVGMERRCLALVVWMSGPPVLSVHTLKMK